MLFPRFLSSARNVSTLLPSMQGRTLATKGRKTEKKSPITVATTKNDALKATSLQRTQHVSDTLEDLFNYLNDKRMQGVQWARFGKLNEHLKGHRPGELTIVTGPTGCGKTTFVSEYSLDLCEQGVRTLWGSFEIKYLNLERIMLTQLVGRSFDVSDREEFDRVTSKMAQLPLYLMNFHGQTDIEEVLKEARYNVLLHGIEHFVIDNLQFMLGLTTDSSVDRFHKQDLVLGRIRQFATMFNCHITLVAHPRKEKEEVAMSNNSLYGGVKASQEADNIMIIMNKYHPRFRCNKYLQITKNRAHGSLGVVPLYFDKNSLCFSLHHKAEDQVTATKATAVSKKPKTAAVNVQSTPSQPAFGERELVDEDENAEVEDDAEEKSRSHSRMHFDDANDSLEIHYGDFKAFLQDQRKRTIS